MGLLTFDLNDQRKEYLRKRNTARDALNQTSSPTDPGPVPEPPMAMSAPEPPNTAVGWNKRNENVEIGCFIVVPLLQDLNEKRKKYFNNPAAILYSGQYSEARGSENSYASAVIHQKREAAISRWNQLGGDISIQPIV
ncbi:hypothetical protein DAPPUDRAFT_255388 [Daphnia pulex]|uniref:Uncharacterized protein n=1 Tax=Daphnia pulex TaxID=6669 RepID=E9H932_DAPPU|nr:hypothetical protein DAPPUDRAFT_255388 [Daphnia pulex]|eukprot:EFX71767.1 hypothetical protein DAPPUDRAFT_255388 [Daphnia pulex]